METSWYFFKWGRSTNTKLQPLNIKACLFENLVDFGMKTQVAYKLLGTRQIWKLQFANPKPRMETWQFWNGKLKLEMHYWKQDKYDTPICKP